MKKFLATALCGCVLLLTCASCGQRGHADPILSSGAQSSENTSSLSSGDDAIPTAGLDSPLISSTLKGPGNIGYGEKYQQYEDFPFYLRGASFESFSRTESPQGFYYRKSGNNGGYLFYATKDSMEPIPLCNKPNCQHHLRKIDSGDVDSLMECNAFIYDIQSLSYYDGWLYGFGNLDPKTNDVAMYRISLDGTVKEKIHTFRTEGHFDNVGTFVPDDPDEYFNWIFDLHRGYLYYESISSEYLTLYRIPFNDLEAAPETVGKWSRDNTPTQYQYYDHYVYFYTANSPEKGYVRIDLDTLEESTFPRENETNMPFLCGGKILLCSDKTHKSYLTELDGSNMQTLIDFDEGQCITYAGGYYVKDNSPGRMDKAADGRYTFTFYDKDCNEQGEIVLASDGVPHLAGSTKDFLFFYLHFHGKGTEAYYNLATGEFGIFDCA